MEKQIIVTGNIFGFSKYEIISQYDKNTSVNLTTVEQLVYSKPNHIFKDMNVNNGLLQEKNEECEEQEDFEKVNLETDKTILEVPFHDLCHSSQILMELVKLLLVIVHYKPKVLLGISILR